jgi:RNA polymerase sigma-70 factor (ECF subfamily)
MLTAGQVFSELPRDAADIAARHGDFVWRTLQRLGVPEADLDDVYQEVMIVVHRQLGAFEGRSKTTTWLYAICVRVASTYRRLAWFRRERPTFELPERASPDAGPDELLGDAEERRALREVLDLMVPEKRAVFVMFELDEMPCDEIAQIVGVPIGTIHSRLHAARQDFQGALRRWQARHERRSAKRWSLLAAISFFLGWRGLAIAGIALAGAVGARAYATHGDVPEAIATSSRAEIENAPAPLVPSAPPSAAEPAPAAGPAPAAVASPKPVVTAAPSPNDTLASELALVARGRAELAADPASALRALEEHARRFPNGKLTIERELLALDALERLGRSSEARVRATRLLSRARGTIYEDRVRAHVDRTR